MVAVLIAALVAGIMALGEWLQAGRRRRVQHLVFGPSGRSAPWARVAPFAKVLAAGSLAWGATTLALLTPKVHEAQTVPESEYRHLVIALDVSPSMRLNDAGPDAALTRMQRAREVLESFFERVAVQQYRLSVVAFYTDAKPVVVDTNDVEVVRNILDDLPLHHAFKVGKTDLFAGLAKAAEVAKPWNPNSTTILVVSDGDSVPPSGMPRMPASVRDVVVIGVGDPTAGRFIDGRNSRQDVTALRQVALRLGGVYHDGNTRHLSSDLLAQLTKAEPRSAFEMLTLREYALLALGIGGGVLGVLAPALHLFGSPRGWRRAVTHRAEQRRAA